MSDKEDKCTCGWYYTCKYCKDTAARGSDKRQMAARKQEIEHVERMKNLEKDVYGRKLADVALDKLSKVTRVKRPKFSITRQDVDDHLREGSRNDQWKGDLGAGFSQALVPLSGQAGLSQLNSSSSSGKRSNSGATTVTVSFDEAHFKGCQCPECR